jgi:hypothetical protein
MKRMILLLLIGAWAVVLAQTPSGEEPGAAPDAPENAVPCVPTGEAGSPDDEQVDGESAAEPCLEPSPETFPEEEPFLSEESTGVEDETGEIEEEFGSVIEENSLPTEASPEEEFKPDDEISEDYPVPLPSDI